MTSEQKSQLIRLREEGLGYVKIGQILGVSKDTVRSFCRRNEPGALKKHVSSAVSPYMLFPGVSRESSARTAAARNGGTLTWTR